MSGATVLLTTFGVVVMAAGSCLFVLRLVGAWRGTNSTNLEHGVVPAIAIMIGLLVLERVTGWPGWPFWAYFLVPIVLAVTFCMAILRAGNRDPIDS